MLTIDGLIIDAEVMSEHALENEITDHPVEAGADLTDHNRPLPIVVNIEGIVSDTPLGVLAETRAGTVPSQDALAILIAIRDAREPVPVVTSLRAYAAMMLKSINVTRDATTGKALRFRATFKETVLVTNERTVKRVSVPRAKGGVNKGTKPTTPVAVEPPKKPAVDTTRPPVRRVLKASGGSDRRVGTTGQLPTATGGSGSRYSPSGKVLMETGGSGPGRRIPTATGGSG